MNLDIKHKSYSYFLPLWTTVRDCLAGEVQVKSKQDVYLPRLTSQEDSGDQEGYLNYLLRASFYGACARTQMGLVGAIMGKEPSLRGVPDEFVKVLTDMVGADYEPLSALTMATLKELVGVGRLALLVDKDADPDARPYIVRFNAEDVVYWRTEWIRGRMTPTLIVLRTTYEEPKDGDVIGHEAKEEPQYLMLRLGDPRRATHLEGVPGVEQFAQAPADTLIYWQEIWRETKQKDQRKAAMKPQQVIVPTMVGGSYWEEIPCDIVNATTGIGTAIEEPPMHALASLALAHYRGSADLEWGRHFTAIPQPWAAGFDIPEGAQLVVGCGYAWVSPQTGAQVGYLEFSGAGLGHIAEGQKEKERQMAVVGARMLEEQPNGVEAMGTVRLRQSGERSVLATIAHNASVALTRAIQRWLAWQSPAYRDEARMAEVLYQLSDDFDTTRLDPAELAALTQALQAGTMSWETYVYNLRRGELLPPGVTDEEERERIQVGAPGRSRRDELLRLQTDAREKRISTRTYLTKLQEMGELEGVDIDAELAAIEEESARSVVRQMEALAGQVIGERDDDAGDPPDEEEERAPDQRETVPPDDEEQQR